MEFVMKGYKGETIHASMSYKELEIKGNWHIMGRQAVESIPKQIIELFDNDPNITAIAITTKKNGVVYQK